MDFNETPFMCPVTSIGMNGTNIFTVNWNCGCVVSEKAIKEAKSEVCHGCGGPFKTEELIQLYPGDDLFKIYQQRIVDERNLKKNKKSEANKANQLAVLAIENEETSNSKLNLVKSLILKIEIINILILKKFYQKKFFVYFFSIFTYLLDLFLRIYYLRKNFK